MTSRERVMTAITRGVPDMVPMMELAIDDAVIQKIMPGASWLDFYEKYELDGVCVFYDLLYEDVAPEVKRDCFGVLNNFKAMEGHFPVPIEPLIGTGMDPMRFLDEHRMPDGKDPRHLAALRQAIDRFKGRKAVVLILHSSMWYPMCMRGYENFLVDIYERPQFIHRLTEGFVDFFVELEKQAIEYGVDVILDGEDYAGKLGLVTSPSQIEEFFLPGLKRLIGVAHDAGIPFVKHCDGNIYPIIDMLIDAGVDCLNPIEPSAGMRLEEVKKKYGGQISLWGNVDCTELLTFKKPLDVREATKRCIAEAAPGGGYILSSSNTIHSAVPAENFQAMVETCRACGRSPLSPGRV
jgi:uroporphyrinogen decarboxylase